MHNYQTIRSLNPVFILAPTTRNGITLIQRLLNSSRKIIIYGENNLLIETLPREIYLNVNIHRNEGQKLEQSRQEFLQNNPDIWTSNLMPDTEPIMNYSIDWFYQLVEHYEDCSRNYGYCRWGVKSPMVSPLTLDRLAELLPNARFLFIYRNLYNAAKSAKARKFIKNDDDLARMARNWVCHVEYVLSLNHSRLLNIQYEDLITNRDTWLGRIEEFTAVTGIDRSVMQRKINTFRGSESNGYSSTGYIKSTKLTDNEMSILKNYAGPLLKTLGYTTRSKAA